MILKLFKIREKKGHKKCFLSEACEKTQNNKNKMDDLLNIFAKVEAYNGKLDETYESLMVQMRELLLGQAAPSVAAAANPAIANVSKDDASTASPQQTKKRLKCLSLLEENESEEAASQAMELGTPVKPLRASNAKLLNVAEELNEQHMASPPAAKAPLPAPRNGKTPNETREQEKECVNSNETETNLMPPPPAPPSNSVQTPQNPPEEQSFSRPQRAAKSKVEKSLREPKLNSKLRRPTNSEEVVVKLEHKQRASQMSDANTRAASKSSISSETSSNKAEESIIVVPGKVNSVVVLDSDDDSSKVDNQTNKDMEKEPMRQLRVKIKREKASMSNEEQNVPPKEKENSELNIQEPAPVVPTITTTADIADATFKAPESVLPPKAHIPLVAIKTEVTTDESTMSSTLLSATTTNSTITSKKGRKKKEPHRPIKVERFSDIDKASPISSRTRKGASETTVDNNAGEQQQKTRAGTLYEDAIDSAPTASNTATPPSRLSQVPSEVLAAAASNAAASATFCNQTMTVSNATMNMGSAPADATYLANATFKTSSSNNQNPDATVTLNKNSGAGLSDVTFDVQGNANNTTESTSTKHSMVTAQEHDSLITEDESFEQRAAQTAAMPAPKLVKPKAPVPGKSLTAAAKAAYKMPSRNELFNPLVQSPVKMRVEAFEHAASAAAENTKNTRPKRTKENMTPNQSGVGSYTTPTIGKLKAPALGRFLTPTQTSNVPTSATIAAAKKAPSSASKAMAYPKTTVTTTTKPLSRENSGDDFRKGLHLISEERKKQREQKHLLAAQQREAKERERAERIQKLAKEREEKRLKKQMEAEQKKREIEEIQRKLRQQEEAAQAAEAAKIKAAKDREMLMQMKQQQLLLAQQNAAKPKFVMPPPPKPTSKYTFAMLHEDDSTDDEGKTSYKRPPPPTWSRSHVRGEAITRQQYAPTAIIDSFFSVQPTTPDLKLIFPNIDARYLKRNSSALWSTPPRYSELPKY